MTYNAHLSDIQNLLCSEILETEELQSLTNAKQVLYPLSYIPASL